MEYGTKSSLIPSHTADKPFSSQKNDEAEQSEGTILESQAVIKPAWNAVGEALSPQRCDVELSAGDVASH